MGRLTPDQMRDWVAASCAAQGVPLHGGDARVLEQVRALLTGAAARPARAPALARAARRSRSQPPDDLEPAGVQGSGSAPAGTHQHVIDDGFHDGDLPGEVERPPRRP